MSAKTFLRFYHKIDIYTKTIVVNEAGQKTISFSKAATIPAVFQSSSSERRVAPYIDNIDDYQFYVSYQDAAYISYNNRILNVKDRYGNVLETGPLEITNIEKKMGFGGRLHHIFITTRKVVEHA